MKNVLFLNDYIDKIQCSGTGYVKAQEFAKYMSERNPDLLNDLIVPFFAQLEGNDGDDMSALNIVAGYLYKREPFPRIERWLIWETVCRAKKNPSLFIAEEKDAKDATANPDVIAWWKRTLLYYLRARMEIKNKPELITRTKLVLFQIFSCLRQSV